MYWNLHYVSPFYAAPTRLSRQFPINIVSLHTKKENRIQMEEESFQELGRQEHLYKEGNRVGIKINIQRDGNLLSSLAVMSAPQERRKQRENMFGKWQRQVSQPGMKKNGLLEGDNQKKRKTDSPTTMLLRTLGQRRGITGSPRNSYLPQSVSEDDTSS